MRVLVRATLANLDESAKLSDQVGTYVDGSAKLSNKVVTAYYLALGLRCNAALQQGMQRSYCFSNPFSSEAVLQTGTPKTAIWACLQPIGHKKSISIRNVSFTFIVSLCSFYCQKYLQTIEHVTIIGPRESMCSVLLSVKHQNP